MDMGKTVKTADVEKAIKEYKLDPEIIYSGEGNKEIVIRTIKSLDSDQRAKVISTINENFGTTDDDVVAEELFGPSVGKELRKQCVLAVLIAGHMYAGLHQVRFRQCGGLAERRFLGVLRVLISSSHSMRSSISRSTIRSLQVSLR